MARQKLGTVSRRAVLRSAGAAGALLASGAGVNLFNTRRSLAAELPDPQSVLAKINVGNYVRKPYRDQYGLKDDDELWDPAKDWIRTVDWEAVRKQFAGTTVRFAIGAADAESAQDGLEPFRQLSGITIELVPIPDDSLYDKVVAEFLSGNASFDALQFFSPWLGDFVVPGFLAKLDDYAEKWKLPLDDFYDTYKLNYGYWAGQGLYGIPFDCDFQMLHVRPSLFKQVTGGELDTKNSVKTYGDLIRLTGELNKVGGGVAGIGLLGARGFWSTYTWEHVAAQYGMDLFNDKWEPVFNNEAGVQGLETVLALAKNSQTGVAGWGWAEDRAAWLGGQLASNLSWQDSGTQATRPDQSTIVGDVLTIYEPRVPGGRFAPPNIAGSTSVVTATSKNAEGAFLMLAFLTTASIMAMNEANANGVAPGYKSVLNNAKLRKVSQPTEVLANELDFAWCAPRLPGMFEMEQALGNEINKAIAGQATAKEALDAGAKAWKEIMDKNGFYASKPPVEFAAFAEIGWLGKGKTPPA